MKWHTLLPSSHYEGLRERNLRAIARTEEQLRTGEGIPQLCYEVLLRRTLSNGCIALILDRGDEEARENFTASAEYALKLLDAPGRRGGGMRSYEAHVKVSEEGSRLTALHEKVPQPGSENLSIKDYYLALICIVAFGEPEAFAMVASVPENRYRNPGTIAADETWQFLRGLKASLKGDEADAKVEARGVLSRGGDMQPEASALLALLARDTTAFAEPLKKVVEAHRKRGEKEPNDPVGVVCLPGLMLCRLAKDRGIVMEEDPYLPLRLLPNYRAA
jgi:hypothetical protein